MTKQPFRVGDLVVLSSDYPFKEQKGVVWRVIACDPSDDGKSWWVVSVADTASECPVCGKPQGCKFLFDSGWMHPFGPDPTRRTPYRVSEPAREMLSRLVRQIGLVGVVAVAAEINSETKARL
jgi:hypothetical protein